MHLASVTADATRELVEVIGELYGADVSQRVALLLADPARFIAAPATLKVELEDILSAHRDRLTVTPEGIKRYFRAGVALERLKDSMRSREAESAQELLAGTQTLEFLRASRAALDVGAYCRCVQELEDIDGASVLNPSVFNQVTSSLPFEAIVRDIADAMRRAAESWYRPMLTTLLRITYARLGADTSIPSELGKLINVCRPLWQSRGGPTAALSDEIRIIRNSESHRNTRIDVRDSKVTFVNRRGNGHEEMLGPFDRDGFATLTKTFFAHCVAMRKAFAAVDPD